MSAKHFIAFDLGATSGRTILGTLEKDGVLTTKEITRFPNGMMEINGHLYWNIYSLYEHIREGLLQVAKTGVTPTSIGIDTWGRRLCLHSFRRIYNRTASRLPRSAVHGFACAFL